MEFILKQEDNQGAYVVNVDGNRLGEISWMQLGNIMVMNHTFVDNALRGQGVAKKLLDHAAEFARKENFKMEPVCSYVVSTFANSTDYDDLKLDEK